MKSLEKLKGAKLLSRAAQKEIAGGFGCPVQTGPCQIGFVYNTVLCECAPFTDWL